jgi:mannose-6-phosphate isomerase
VKKGDLYFVEGGVPHAIGGGCLMVELQEPSDLMVIPERKTPSGVLLADVKLHGGLGFEKMWDCFNYEGMSEAEVKAKYYRHVDESAEGKISVVDASLTQRFSLDVLRVNGEFTTDFCGKYAVCVVTDGSITLSDGDEEYKLSKSDKFFVPASCGKLLWKGKGEVTINLPCE